MGLDSVHFLGEHESFLLQSSVHTLVEVRRSYEASSFGFKCIEYRCHLFYIAMKMKERNTNVVIVSLALDTREVSSMDPLSAISYSSCKTEWSSIQPVNSENILWEPSHNIFANDRWYTTDFFPRRNVWTLKFSISMSLNMFGAGLDLETGDNFVKKMGNNVEVIPSRQADGIMRASAALMSPLPLQLASRR